MFTLMLGDDFLVAIVGDKDSAAASFIEAADDEEESSDDLGWNMQFTDRRFGGIAGGVFLFALSVPDETE